MTSLRGIIYRGPRQGDVAYISKAWKESLRSEMMFEYGNLDPMPFYKEMDRRVPRLLSRSTVVVACNPADEDHILGWIAAEGQVVHYVFVRRAWRSKGLAQRLLDEAGVSRDRYIYGTHRTIASSKLYRILKARYTPRKRDRDHEKSA